MKVLNFGSLNYDYVYQVDHFVTGGETETSISMETHLGGKGFNQSVALAKAGLTVYHGGSLGEEGEAFLTACREYGVHTEYIRTIQGRSGHTVIQVNPEAQNGILLYGGANRKQDEAFIDEVLSHFEKGDMIVLQNEVNLLGYIIDRAYEKGLSIVLNPSPYDAFLEEVDMGKVSIFLMNEIEGEMMTGEKDPGKILAVVREKYPDAGTVLTLGTAGAYYQDKEGHRTFQEAFPVKAVDTTAAGDTFTGFFIGGIAEGLPVDKNLRRAAKASSLAVQRRGAAESIPTKAEVETSLEE